MPCAKLSRCLVPLAVALSFAGARSDDGARVSPTAGRQAGELERVQMHRNSLRGVHYLPTCRAGQRDPARAVHPQAATATSTSTATRRSTSAATSTRSTATATASSSCCTSTATA